jgi:hypothetical protein
VGSYLAYSLPALAAGVAVTRAGLHETANVYGVALIGLAVVALLLSHRLEDPQSPAAQRDAEAACAVAAPPVLAAQAASAAEQIQ